VHYARVRPLDGDEGYYATAARLVWEGKTPYHDFAYPQAPLLPYVYSWIWAVHPRSLVAMRFLSAAFGGLAVFLWGVSLLSVKRLPTKVALGTFVVVLLNPYWVSWDTTVKTHALANLLMSIAMVCLYAGFESGRVRWYFLAGTALGACASTRGLYGPLIPVVLLWLFYQEWQASKRPYPNTMTFLGGSICGLLTMLFRFVGDPRAFIFNNVDYHRLLFSHISFRHTLHMDVDVLSSLLNPLHSLPAHYFIFEVFLAVVGGLSWWKLRKKPEEPYTGQHYLYLELALLMLLVYIITATLPLPAGDQYFDSPLTPFLIPFLAEALRVIFRSRRKWVVVGLAVLAPIIFFRETKRGAAEFAVNVDSQLSSFRQVTQAIEANSNADDVVLSFWPGYVFESGRRYFPGSEDDFNYYIANEVSPEARARYHLVSKDEIMNVVSNRAVAVLVTSPYIFDNHLSPAELQTFRADVNANYSLVTRIGANEVFRRR